MCDPETVMSPECRRELAKERGDVVGYVTAVAADIGYSLEEVAVLNLDKLQSRQDRDQLHGSGDDR
jgi:NTP pyrophosphatase (non-canonical NTP hydrolase)